MLVISCTTSYESKGNGAYREALRAADGSIKRIKFKEAYYYYKKAIETYPNRIGLQLRNRFIEMTLERAEMVLNEGSAEMDALPLFMKDIDKHLTADVDAQNKERYATFLVNLADSCFSKLRLYEGLNLLDKAAGVATNKAPIEAKKKGKMDNFAQENYDAAELEMANGKANEDAEALVRAEFMVKVAIMYDENYPNAQRLLSDLYKENRGTYSAYEAVVTDRPDSNIYDAVNKYDILLAVPDLMAGRNPVLKTEMYNYSCNPQRLRAKNFFIEDVNGKRFYALPSSKFGKEILDQEFETKMTLRFRSSGAKIKKLAYETEDKEHYTEKVFF
jgi:hypothetical protein